MNDSETARKLAKLIKAGKCTSTDIFHLQFQGNPPPGLDIDPDLRLAVPIEISLKSDLKGNFWLWCNSGYYEDKEGSHPDALSESYLNWYTHKEDDAWFAQEAFFKDRMKIEGKWVHSLDIGANLNLLGHETIHAKQCQFHNLRALVFPLEFPKNPACSDVFGVGPEMEEIMLRGEKASQTRRRHSKIVAANKLDDQSKNPFYYHLEVERQARLHQILSEGWKKWERVPLTPREIKAALAEALGAPELLDAEDRRLAAQFPLDHLKDNTSATEAIKDLKEKCVAKMSHDDRVTFFTRVIPYSYGYLLDLWGDRQGSLRMDYAPGIKPRPRESIAMAHQILAERYHSDLIPTWGDEKWQEKLDHAQPKSLERLLAVSMVNCNQRVFEHVLHEIDRKPAEKLNPQQLDYLCGAAISHHGGAHVARPDDSQTLENMIELLRARGALSYLATPAPALHIPAPAPSLSGGAAIREVSYPDRGATPVSTPEKGTRRKRGQISDPSLDRN